MNDSLRGTGRTTRMLLEVIEMLPNASFLPILVYCGNESNARHMKQMFVDILRERNIPVRFGSREEAIVRDDERVCFRSFCEEDSPRGGEYSHIFVDHFAEEEQHRREMEPPRRREKGYGAKDPSVKDPWNQILDIFKPWYM